MECCALVVLCRKRLHTSWKSLALYCLIRHISCFSSTVSTVFGPESVSERASPYQQADASVESALSAIICGRQGQYTGTMFLRPCPRTFVWREVWPPPMARSDTFGIICSGRRSDNTCHFIQIVQLQFYKAAVQLYTKSVMIPV
jgi:hypothetical protein